MEFSSILFLCFFFPLFFSIYYLIPKHWKNKWLLIGSFFFLSFGRDSFIWYFLLLIGITYFTLLKLNHLPKKISKKKILIWIIMLEIGIWYLFIRNSKDFIYPLCYTIILLSNIGTLLDFYRNKRKVPSLFHYLLYISCFSKLLFGPVISYYEMETEIKNRKICKETITKGCFQFLKGVFMNVLLVGMLQEFINELYLIESISASWMLLLVTLLQIGLFMMSYSNMSIGLSTMLGFTFKNETNYPLCLSKMKYFLSAWHFSLTTWWDKYLLFQKKIPFGIKLILLMFLLSFCYSFNYHILLWFLFIGIGIFLESIVSKNFSYPFHFVWLLLSCIMIVRPNILETINRLFYMTSLPLIDKATWYYFCSYFVVVMISILVSCKIVKKITDKFTHLFWYHMVRNVIYCILLMVTLITLVSGVNHSIWIIKI